MQPDYTDEQLIDAAWHHPTAMQWQPSERNPTCRVTIRPKTTKTPSGLIVPPSLRGVIPEGPTFTVEFVCEFGTVDGKPAFQITGRHGETRKVVHQGWLQKRPV